jgi:predicted permease
VAISVVLLVSCGLVLRTLNSVQGIDPGFDTEGLLASYMSTSSTGLPAEERELFYRELAEHMEELPWVTAATVAAQAPLAGHPTEEFRPEGQDHRVAVTVAQVVPGFFEKVGIPLRQGRSFEPFDDVDAPLVVVLNETAARLYFEGENPVGRRVSQDRGEGEPPASFEVVGVVGDARVTNLLGDPEPVVYLSYPQHYYTPGNALLLSVSVNPRAAANLLQQELRAVDPMLALVNALPYSEVVAGFTYPQRMNVELFTLLAMSGLILAAVGIFAVLSLAVGERTREIGIRLTIGAPKLDIVRAVAGRAALAVGLGTAAGLVLSVAASSLVQGLLMGVEAVDPPSMAVGTLVLLAAAALATWLPTLRALRVDAATSLRVEQ